METAPRRLSSYVLSVWVDHHAGDLPVWRGVLVTPTEQRLHFSTLAALNHHLCELTGWQDPPPAEESTPAPTGPGTQETGKRRCQGSAQAQPPDA